MQIEQVTYLKSITIKNKLLQPKNYYLILHVDDRLFVGPVIFLGIKEKEKFAAWDRVDLIVRKNRNVVIEMWQYDSFIRIGRIQVDIKNCMNQNSFKIEIQLFNIEILCSSSVKQNQSKIKESANPQKTNKNQLIFPLIKTLDHFLTNKQNSFSINLYKSQESQFSSVESLIWSDTSLEKIMQSSSKGSDIKLKQGKKHSLQKAKNCSKQEKKQNLILFDDYEARPKRKQINQQFVESVINRSTNKQQQKNFKEANSTASSSLVKKNLKHTIAKLTQNPLRIHQKQRQNSSSQNSKNISRQWLVDYGLIQNKRSLKKQSLSKNGSKIKDRSIIYESFQLRQFCEKSLSKEQIQNVESLSSLQLSQSIFQQYGLDLSTAKRTNTKSRQKRKTFLQKSSENDGYKKVQAKNRKMSQKITAFNVQYKFQDYGQQQIYRNAKRVK